MEALNNGYTELPAGKLAAVVTYLEMRTPPPPELNPIVSEYQIRRVPTPEVAWYRELYRRVGEPWLWFSRLRMSDDEVRAILHHPQVDVFALSYNEVDDGLLEFDRRKMPDIEILYFGVTPALIGKGAGRTLLRYGLAAEWQHRPQRVWLHTCNWDHPKALAFYIREGFVPYKRGLEIADDPRLTGDLPRDVAPGIPIL